MFMILFYIATKVFNIRPVLLTIVSFYVYTRENIFVFHCGWIVSRLKSVGGFGLDYSLSSRKKVAVSNPGSHIWISRNSLGKLHLKISMIFTTQNVMCDVCMYVCMHVCILAVMLFLLRYNEHYCSNKIKQKKS